MNAIDPVRFQLEDLATSSWESRHSLFAHFALYGALFAALAIVAAPLPRRARAWVVVALSIASLGVLGSWTMAALAVAFALAFFAAVERIPGRAGTAAATALLAALLAYPALLPDDLLRGNPHSMREFWAFATNVWLLRCVAYLVDRRSRGRPRRSLREYLVGTLLFPTFVNGPIESVEQVSARASDGPAVETWEDLTAYARSAAENLGRFLWGTAKVLLATFYLGQQNETIFATSGTAVGHPRLWLWAVELYFQFYVVFSGWTDVSVALGRLMGFGVCENFDHPWRARSVADFWRRWHISFGHWLRDYVYIPLGGNRRHVTANVMATFVASALWHVWGALKVLGLSAYPPVAWLGFVSWGAMNGAAVVAARWWSRGSLLAPARAVVQRGLPAPLRDRGAQALAFGFVAVAWIPFFLPPWIDPSTCWHIFRRLVFLE